MRNGSRSSDVLRRFALCGDREGGTAVPGVRYRTLTSWSRHRGVVAKAEWLAQAAAIRAS